MPVIKLLDELLCDIQFLLKAANRPCSWKDVENHTSVTAIAIQKIRDKHRNGKAKKITRSLAIYLDGEDR